MARIRDEDTQTVINALHTAATEYLRLASVVYGPTERLPNNDTDIANQRLAQQFRRQEADALRIIAELEAQT